MPNKQKWLGAIIIVLVVIIGVGLFYFTKNPIRSKATSPNFIFILTDDLDYSLMPYMKNTNSLITDQGATFTNYFVTSSACCPSRASTIRGQYPHNTGILENSPGFKTFHRNGEESETIATWLHRDWYQTSLLGKYLNIYPTGATNTYIPAGWTDWHAFLYSDDGERTDFYYNYQINENGKVVQYGGSPSDYSTDVLKNRALTFIEQNAKSNRPFFIYLAPYAPHGPDIPAPRYADQFSSATYPQKPSFGEADINDKPTIVRANPQKNGTFDVGDANRLFVSRVQTMQALDEMVKDLVNQLDQAGELQNTYIILTSDNGFHMGEHQLPSGKMLPYEEDIRVPFVMRGPGIQPKTQITQMVANIDVAPTIAELAGARASNFVDGRSFANLLNPSGQQVAWRKALLIELGYTEIKTPIIAFRGIRAENFVYVEYEDGALEYYNLITDPYELNNIANQLDPKTLTSLHTWLERLKACKAEACRAAETAVPDDLKHAP